MRQYFQFLIKSNPSFEVLKYFESTIEKKVILFVQPNPIVLVTELSLKGHHQILITLNCMNDDCFVKSMV